MPTREASALWNPSATVWLCWHTINCCFHRSGQTAGGLRLSASLMSPQTRRPLDGGWLPHKQQLPPLPLTNSSRATVNSPPPSQNKPRCGRSPSCLCLLNMSTNPWPWVTGGSWAERWASRARRGALKATWTHLDWKASSEREGEGFQPPATFSPHTHTRNLTA